MQFGCGCPEQGIPETYSRAVAICGDGMINLIWKRVKPWCIPVGLTLLFYVLLRHVFLIGYVPTSSMEPTFLQESFILGIWIFDEPQVGDIIVFEKDGALLVKRIAACPGDKVDLSQLFCMTTVPIPVWDAPVITVSEGCFLFWVTI